MIKLHYSAIKVVVKCRLCDSTHVKTAFNFTNHPIVHHLNNSSDDSSYLSDFSLYECTNCGFLFSPDYFCPADELYKNYITLSSAKEDPHAETIITRIHQFCDVSDPNICEIGCNDGKFLKRLKSNGFKKLSAIEPAGDAYQCAKKILPNVHNNFFSEEVSKEIFQQCQFDFVITRQVLEHIRDLHDFLKGIDYILNKNGNLVIEVPDHTMNYELFDYSFWEEHINYFTFNTLKKLLRSRGFYIFHHENVLFQAKH